MKFESQDYPKNLANTGPEAIGLQVERADGPYIWDSRGKRYLDMISGVAVMNLGHNHPSIRKAIDAQLDQHAHVMVYGEFIQESNAKLAAKLNELLPDQLNCSYFVNSGTEANEAAIKLARRYTGRSKIISCKGAYHGSTLGSLSISGNEQKKKPFKPLIPDIHFIGHNEVEDLNLIDEQTAAVIIEPIQGDAGVQIADQAYLKALRKKCDEVEALLIFDEIQSGIGRTGKLFSFMHFDVIPDVLTSGKALGGGLPIGAFISSQEIMDSLRSDPPLGHITTFGGNPVCCASAHAVLSLLEDGNIMQEVEAKGKLLEEGLSHPMIKAVRRKGLMLGIDLESAEAVQFLIHNALDHGLILFWFLSRPQGFRIAPPLNTPNADLHFAAKTICKILDEYKKGPA